MSDVSLRLAESRDAEGIAECIRAAYSIYASRIHDLPAVSEGIPETIEHSRVWVVEREGRIVGAMILVPEHDCMVLENIAVIPECAGMGLGRTLIGRAEQDCVALGLREIQLSTHKDMPENVAIYSRLGWKETGRSGTKVHMSKAV